jgi:hypothetical protein
MGYDRVDLHADENGAEVHIVVEFPNEQEAVDFAETWTHFGVLLVMDYPVTKPTKH